MNLLKIFLSATLLMVAFLFSGCQGDNGDTIIVETPTDSSGGTVPPSVPDANTSNPSVTLVLPISSAVLTTNNQVVNIAIRVFDSANNPYSSGNIVKINPNDVLTGRDIGEFDKITSPLVNGVANFAYTAPKSLDANTSNISFGFYHDSNSSDVKVFTMSIVPDVNQSVLTSYTLQSSNPSDVNMNLESSKTFSYTVYNANNVALPDSSVAKITVTSLNPSLALIKDNTQNPASNILTISNQNNFTINLISNTKSGLVPIKVDATFNDENGVEQNLTKIFNTVVFSGPPTAASLGYVSSSFDANTGLYTEKWRLMVVDKYTNLVNSNPSVSSSMIVGYAKSSVAVNDANYSYFPTSGTLAINGTKGQLTSSIAAFTDVDLVNDNLVIFGTGYKFNAFGKWEIATVTSPTVLELSDDFNATSTTALGFAVGHNFRNETCGDHNSAVASVKALNNNTTLSDDGILILEATFNDYMVGKSVILSTNFVGGHNNISGQLGYARKITFVGTGLNSEIYKISKGDAGVKRLNVFVNDSPHGITYKNANFGYSIESTATETTISYSSSSMVAGITDCSVGGSAYVDVNISGTSGAGGDGELKLINLRIGAEF